MSDSKRNCSEYTPIRFRKTDPGPRVKFSTRPVIKDANEDQTRKDSVLMNRLIALLKEYETVPGMDQYSDSYVSHNQEHAETYPPEARRLLKEIGTLADSLLITANGHPNYFNIAELTDDGYHVGPGEQDSFGWLTGVITTKSGMVVFG